MSRDRTRRILLVDDEPGLLYLLQSVLDAPDREILTAESAAEAEQVLADRSVDLVVLDLILPDMDGRALLTRMRERAQTSTVPVVVISARGGAEIRQECFTRGADSFWEKPFDAPSLAADVAARLELSVGRDRSGVLDPLTGLRNRAGLMLACEQTSGAYNLALVRIDGFAAASERWGWDLGERMVAEVAEVIKTAMLRRGGVFRLGGGEFALFFDAGHRDGADAAATAVVERVRGRAILDPSGEPLRMTASVGMVEVAPKGSLGDALDRARARLFRAQDMGRDSVIFMDTTQPEDAPRVVVAEDDDISATILLHRLEKEGLSFDRYDNGRAALEAVQADPPDLLILDVKLPGMDGFEVLGRLRRSPLFEQLPIVMLTSMGREADVVRGFQLGADDYVLKPFSPIELSARLWRLLRRGRPAAPAPE
jgi:diguanylate cyclase (GGDEF)-like protein